MVTERMVLHRNIFREMKRQKHQIEIALYFQNNLQIVPPFLSPPFPHLFHLCHPETARPIPLLPPAHPTQCENDKDENLNDDTLPLPK